MKPFFLSLMLLLSMSLPASAVLDKSPVPGEYFKVYAKPEPAAKVVDELQTLGIEQATLLLARPDCFILFGGNERGQRFIVVVHLADREGKTASKVVVHELPREASDIPPDVDT